VNSMDPDQTAGMHKRIMLVLSWHDSFALQNITLDEKEEYKETTCQHQINMNKILIKIYLFPTYLLLWSQRSQGEISVTEVTRVNFHNIWYQDLIYSCIYLFKLRESHAQILLWQNLYHAHVIRNDILGIILASSGFTPYRHSIGHMATF
jgi:hypothetical protein